MSNASTSESESTPTGGEARASFLPLLAIVLLVGLAFRLANLTERSLWLDEFTSIQVASLSLSEILGGSHFNHHTPPGYYILLHLWFSVFSADEFGLRLFSVALDLANVALVFGIFRKQFGLKPGFIAGTLYAISAYPIYYAQEGRMYSLTAMLVLITYSCALDVLSGRATSRTYFTATLAGIIGVYTHYYFSLSLFAISIALLWSLRFRVRELLPWALSMGVIALAFLPWVGVVLHLATSESQDFRKFVTLVLPYTLFRYAAGYGVVPLQFGLRDHVFEAALAQLGTILAFGGIFGLASFLGLKRVCREFADSASLFLSCLFLPALLAWLISLKTPLLSERYLIVSYPFFIASIGLLPWSRKSSRMLLFVKSCLLLLTSFATVEHYFNPEFGNTDWRRAAAVIKQTAEPNDVVTVAPGYSKDVLNYYLKSSTALSWEGPVELGNLVRNNREGKIFLVETGSSPSVVPEIESLGFKTTDSKFFPQEIGLRVVRLERASDSDPNK